MKKPLTMDKKDIMKSKPKLFLS